jgi:zinc-binding alcohol dehydrogenase family protein
MKVISFRQSLPISDPESFLDLNKDRPGPRVRDLLVEIRAIGINPVDAKIRAGGGPGSPGGDRTILGWDAAGIVRAIGPAVMLFAPGDEVFYAGSIDRPGCYAEYQCVDERIVGRKPRSVGFAESAAMPLTTITAWEMLFHRLKVDRAQEGSLLIVGGAGGVGSISTQLARELTSLNVIATASRPDTRDWCLKMGAHYVVDHRQSLSDQVKSIAPGGVNYVLALTKVEDHFDEIIESMAPQSAMALIENPAQPLEITKLKPKSISLHWEFMFTRSRFQTADMGEQGRLLTEVGALMDASRIRTTLRTNLGQITAENMKRAHALVESGRTIGKIVLEGFSKDA